MNRALSTLTAATAGMGLTVAATSAKAFVIAPAVAAAALAGGIFGGAVLGSAATSSAYNYPYRTPVVVAPGPSVTVNSTTCHFAHRWINGVRTRVRVCRTATAPEPVAEAPVAVSPYAEPYAYTAYGAPEVIAPPGGCEMISGNRVCF